MSNPHLKKILKRNLTTLATIVGLGVSATPAFAGDSSDSYRLVRASERPATKGQVRSLLKRYASLKEQVEDLKLELNNTIERQGRYTVGTSATDLVARLEALESNYQTLQSGNGFVKSLVDSNPRIQELRDDELEALGYATKASLEFVRLTEEKDSRGLTRRKAYQIDLEELHKQPLCPEDLQKFEDELYQQHLVPLDQAREEICETETKLETATKLLERETKLLQDAVQDNLYGNTGDRQSVVLDKNLKPVLFAGYRHIDGGNDARVGGELCVGGKTAWCSEAAVGVGDGNAVSSDSKGITKFNAKARESYNRQSARQYFADASTGIEWRVTNLLSVGAKGGILLGREKSSQTTQLQRESDGKYVPVGDAHGTSGEKTVVGYKGVAEVCGYLPESFMPGKVCAYGGITGNGSAFGLTFGVDPSIFGYK